MKTKRLHFSLCTLMCFCNLFAQEVQDYGFLFPQFTNGLVNFKNKTNTQAFLNYSTINQEMVFIDKDSTIMEFINTSDIASVTIDDRSFIPIPSKRFFFEVIRTKNGSFYVQYVSYLVSQGKATAYGAYSETVAQTSIGNITNSSSRYLKLQPDEKFRMKREEFFYLKSGNKYKKIISVKSFSKLFKGQSSQIEKFAEDNSINFSKSDDIAKIAEYAFDLMNK